MSLSVRNLINESSIRKSLWLPLCDPQSSKHQIKHQLVAACPSPQILTSVIRISKEYGSLIFPTQTSYRLLLNPRKLGHNAYCIANFIMMLTYQTHWDEYTIVKYWVLEHRRAGTISKRLLTIKRKARAPLNSDQNGDSIRRNIAKQPGGSTFSVVLKMAYCSLYWIRLAI